MSWPWRLIGRIGLVIKPRNDRVMVYGLIRIASKLQNVQDERAREL